ncbi:MAG: UvrD-helicase domain-containing protein [Synechococcaceae cyanobacterium SM2_3_2]|nr:UvrD-helicase domain-containing protein [Synechococcaceae cyanobacterium SM2_3_2]
MSHFPVILLPPRLESVLKGSLDPQPFSIPAPRPLAESPPVAIQTQILTIQAVGGGLLSGLLALTVDPWAGLAALSAAAGTIGYQVWQQGQSYPQRLQLYEKKLAAHQTKIRQYQQAKARHQENETLRQTPEGRTQLRYKLVMEALSQTQLPFGNQSTAPSGLSEGFFLTFLDKYFPNQIRSHLQVKHPTIADRYYSPDFAFVDEQRRLLIDIEIDEPYAFDTQRVTHQQGADQKRDNHFLSLGWVVVRFSEDQIITAPDSCCKALAIVVTDITGDKKILAPFESVPNLSQEPQWTLETGNQLLIGKSREQYRAKLSKFHRPKPPLLPQPKSKIFVPSHYQRAIFEWIREGQGDGLVVAVAGSGKSTTLVQAAQQIKTRNGIFLAFNKSIAVELNRKLGEQMEARTINSLGFQIVRGLLPDAEIRDYKYSRLLPNKLSKQERKSLTELVKLSRLTLTNLQDPEAIREMADHHGLDPSITKQMFPHLSPILEQGIQQAQELGILDFIDQVWLPTVLDLPSPQYEWIFCDECQDLSPAQLELILRCRKPGGRVLFVGDPHQAIYGFAGADSASVQKIQLRTQAKELPLSICYRCPASHIKLAQQIVPQIEARENAPDGIIRTVKVSQVATLLEPGDLILCRMNAPLLKLCLELLVKGIPASIQGGEIRDSLIEIINMVEQRKDFDFSSFAQYLTIMENEQINRMRKEEASQTHIETYKDKVQAIRTAFATSASETVDEFCREIDALFTEGQDRITLCTVHKAKGLESNRVFILQPEKLPLSIPGQKEWELQQEMNLKYVALTRAKQELFFIES